MASNFPRLTIRDLFDADFYRRNNPDLAGFSGSEAFSHFDRFGAQERRDFSPFFDIDFYLQNNGDVVATFAPGFPGFSGSNYRLVVDHFINNGIYEGRRFTPLPVDLEFYRANNPDLADFDRSQLLNHLIDLGINEGRRFSPEIDLNFYRSTYPDLAGLSNIELLQHFNNFGRQEGRVAIPTIGQTLTLFDVDFYRASNQNLPANILASNQELTQHFLNFGRNELRKFSPFFDARYYIDNNPDLGLAGIDTNQEALDHFQRYGLNEGRRFSQFFDVNYYLANNPDLRAAGFNRQQAVAHFIQFGLNEGRRPSTLFDPAYYIANNPDLLAQQVSFRQAFQEFQVGNPPSQAASGFQLARPASIAFDPGAIAPLLSPNPGVPATSQAEWLQRAARWGSIPVGGTLTYSFVTTASAFLYNGEQDETNVSEIPPEIKNNIRNVMRQYNELLGINLVEVPDRPPNVGRIRIMFSNGPIARETLGYVTQPSDSPGDDRSGDMHLNPNSSEFLSAGPGSLGYQSLLYVVGLSLGLDDYTDRRAETRQGFVPDLIPALDNNTNTVASETVYGLPTSIAEQFREPYTYRGAYARTPMAYDIRALQYLYGASYLNNTDTTYRYDAGNFINIKQAIWDGGGIDTLDFSSLPALPPDLVAPRTEPPIPPPAPLPPKTGYYFDMNEGGQLTAQNALNRAIYPVIPPGNQQNSGGNQDNATPPRTANTNVYNTTIGFGVLIENLIGSPGNDEILGNNLANNISGGDGDDQITGARSADILTGGPGADVFVLARGDGGRTIAEADIITDFTPGVDRIGLALGLNLGQIAFSAGNSPNDTILRLADSGEFLAVVQGVPQTGFPPGSFTFA